MNHRVTHWIALATALLVAEATAHARWMNPNTGRFQTMDNLEGNSQQPVSLHKYLYCNGNPINDVDPSGNFVGEGIGIAVGLTVIDSLSAGATAAILGKAYAADRATDVYALAKRLGVKVKWEEEDPSAIYFVHGSSLRTWGPSVRIDPEAGRGDFGYGFYTFRDEPEGRRWAEKRARDARHGWFDVAFVLAVKIGIPDYARLTKLDFTKPANAPAWKPFVDDCRSGRRSYGFRDVIIGPVGAAGPTGTVPNRWINIPQYKFEEGGVNKLRPAYVYPAGLSG
jgi:RHS repeat-associated protein